MLSAVKIAAGLLLCLLVPGAAAGQAPGRVGIGVAIDVDKFEAARVAGFDYVEINASKVAALTDDEFEQLAGQVSRLHIPVASANIFIPGGIKLVGPDIDPARQMAHVAATLTRLERLGVSVVVLGSGGARRVPEGFSRDEAFTQLVDFCRRIAPVARAHGITIAVEPLRRQETNLINTVREGVAFVKAVDRPDIRLVVDFYHLSQEQESADVILEAGALVAHTHIANPQGRVYPLSNDEAAYGPFFASLCKIGYAGRLTIEASTPDFAAQAPRSLAMLRDALACANR
jgi:sugar phosphate isomerase/epimerase